MRNIDLTYYYMFRSVNGCMTKNKLIWEQNQIITSYVNELDTNIHTIDEAETKRSNKASRITLEKKALRTSLNETTFIIKEALRLYYRLHSMTEEMQLLSYPISDLTKMTDANFYMESLHISEKAATLAADLKAIGISVEKITKHKDELQKFYFLQPERDIACKTQAEMVKLIPEKVKECRLMLRNIMDALVSMYKDEHPDFVLEYKNSRQRQERPGRKKHYSVLVKGVVSDTATLQPLENVVVAAGKKNKQTTSDKNGNYQIKIYKKDADSITFSKEGYQNLTLSLPTEFEHHEVVIDGRMVNEES